MIHRWKQAAGVLMFCAALAASPATAFGGTINNTTAILNGPGVETGQYLVKVVADSVAVSAGAGSADVLLEAEKDESFPLLEEMEDGWLKVQIGDEEGYLPSDDSTTLEKAGDEEVAAAAETAAESLAEARVQKEAETAAQAAADRRQQVVNYALQFLGCSYRYGGTNPATGVDCSGFTRYVIQNGAGVSIPRSSKAQANAGAEISAAQLQPGDLIFYGGSARSINHVGMYIGNGQIVHASTYETGVKISPWNYRTPVKMVNVLG